MSAKEPTPAPHPSLKPDPSPAPPKTPTLEKNKGKGMSAKAAKALASQHEASAAVLDGIERAIYDHAKAGVTELVYGVAAAYVDHLPGVIAVLRDRGFGCVQDTTRTVSIGWA